jgi:hypothetical protein
MKLAEARVVVPARHAIGEALISLRIFGAEIRRKMLP